MTGVVWRIPMKNTSGTSGAVHTVPTGRVGSLHIFQGFHARLASFRPFGTTRSIHRQFAVAVLGVDGDAGVN